MMMKTSRRAFPRSLRPWISHYDNTIAANDVCRRMKHGGVLRLKVEQSPQVSGIRSTRGNRELNEDRYQRCTVRLGTNDALYCAVFDGHGGSRAADYCAAQLHKNLEKAYTFLNEHSSPHTQQDGPSIAPLAAPAPSSAARQQRLIEQSLSMAFLETDQQFLATHPASSTDGTTASVAVIQPIINGESDYNSTSITNLLTIGHIGDSRIVLCDSVDGKARQLSVDHSPTLAEERKRIESAGGWISQDSFGQHAVMGMLATSRSIGVAKLKAMGRMIISEPQILSHPIDSRDSFIILMTDGVWNVMNNQECVDVVKHCKDPTSASIALIEIAERYVTYDNATALVVRLDGWPLHTSPPVTKDYTRNLRRYKMRSSMLGARSGLPSSSSFIGDTFIEQRTGVFSNAPHDEVGGNSEAVYQRQDIEMFVIDLFDIIGKDMGGSDIFATDDDVDDERDGSSSGSRAAIQDIAETDKYEFRDRMVKIGRASYHEIQDAIRQLGVRFQQPSPNDPHEMHRRHPDDAGVYDYSTTYPSSSLSRKNDDDDEGDQDRNYVDIAEAVVLKRAFEVVGHSRMIDYPPVDTSIASDNNQHHYHIRALSSLSAADISRALKQLRIRILRKIQ